MKYIIDYAKRGVGTFPQCIKAGLAKGTIDDANYLSSVPPGIAIMNDILIPEFAMEKKARWTDLISVVFPGMENKHLVSPELKAILEVDSIGIQFVPTILFEYTMKETEQYFIVHASSFEGDGIEHDFYAIPNYNGVQPGFVVQGVTYENINRELKHHGIEFHGL